MSVSLILFAACNSGEFLTGLSGSFSSPNYPTNYSQYSRCSWNITVPSGYFIKVSFLDFKLDPIPCGVRGASVVITNVTSDDRKKLRGQSRPSSKNSVGNSVLVIFTSLRYQNRGFNATYRAITYNSGR